MPAQHLNNMSVTDYLTGERLSPEKYEYVAGQVYAMAGAKINHNRITRNFSNFLWNALKDQPCEPFVSDMLVKTAHDRFRYPDVVVVCNDDPSQDDYVRERPILVVEYILVEQDIAEVTVYRRSASWQPSYYYLGEEVLLESIGAALRVEDIYEHVENGDLAQWCVHRLESKGDKY